LIGKHVKTEKVIMYIERRMKPVYSG